MVVRSGLRCFSEGLAGIMTQTGAVGVRLTRIIVILTVLCAALLFATEVIGLSRTAAVIFGIAVLVGTTIITGRKVTVDKSIYNLPVGIRLLASSILCVVLVHFAAGARWSVSIVVIVILAVGATILDRGMRVPRRNSSS